MHGVRDGGHLVSGRYRLQGPIGRVTVLAATVVTLGVAVAAAALVAWSASWRSGDVTPGSALPPT